MSMNKYMHPRNIYNKQPNYRELALKYDEFGRVTTLDVSGKVKINFKDENALRQLTKCLLKHDFGLDVWLPENRLIPTLPLRLNYVLWLEDLLQFYSINDVIGIDIGCGASCIYPLLAARKNHWKMFGLETDEESCTAAKCNVEKNNLTDLIQVHSVNSKQNIFTTIPQTAHFCMCNPPFYASSEEMDFTTSDKNRTGHRSEPNNASSGSQDELTVDGGELEFVKRIIEESIEMKDRIKIFTTMIGHKRNFNSILAFLSNKNITNIAQTEFCQGYTTRWGVAWSFNPFIYLRLAPSCGPTIKNKSMVYTLPGTTPLKSFREIEFIFEKIELDFCDIEFIGEDIARAKIFAYSNTWSNQRRKRREMQRLPCPVLENCINMEIEHEISNKRSLESSISSQLNKRIKVDENNYGRTCEFPFLVVMLVVRKIAKCVQLELQYLSGTGKIDGVHQLLQHVKNVYETKSRI